MGELYFMLDEKKFATLAYLASICRCITVKGGIPTVPCGNVNCVRCSLESICDFTEYTRKQAAAKAARDSVRVPLDHARSGDGVGRQDGVAVDRES